ncbi:XRE family transcriptional regulator [Lentzea sp. NPDC034063]|uniref:helix-turn-helix domain-containing protein n=1 Tax=unclassified Lentzea TaxID=2643253 RepID=UPI0033E74118
MADAGASGQMVALAREAKGWTQLDLAKKSGMAQGSVSKVERGHMSLDEEGLERVASALEVPPALLCMGEAPLALEATCLHHRRRASRMAVVTAKKIEGLTQLVGMSAQRLMEESESGLVLPLHRRPLGPDVTPQDIAAKLRADWGMTPGPVANMTDLLERAGVTVIVRQLGSDAQDAVSGWPPGGHPIVLVNMGLPPDRFRFTLAHELGHLLMHELPDDEQENQANAFAAEFLLPADLIRIELDGLTVRQFGRLAELKARWKVSIAALIQRAAQLECISPTQFKSFRIRLNQYGWNRREPGDLVPEAPTRLRTAIDRHLQTGRTEKELAEIALMLPEQFRRHYLETTASPRPAATSSNEEP